MDSFHGTVMHKLCILGFSKAGKFKIAQLKLRKENGLTDSSSSQRNYLKDLKSLHHGRGSYSEDVEMWALPRCKNL